jgi:hypothetical protein
MKRVCVLICIGMMLLMSLSAQGLGGSRLLSDSEMERVQGTGEFTWCDFGSGAASVLGLASFVAVVVPGGQPAVIPLRIASLAVGSITAALC